MLVLTRKTSERILIGKDIVIEVVECGRFKVKIGIEAPRDVEILREELTKKPDDGKKKP
jgi:carbon storage regulator